MAKSSTIKKLFKIAVSIVVVLILLVMGLDAFVNHWLKRSLPQMLNRSPTHQYNIHYHDFSIDFFTRRLVLNQISILPYRPSGDSSSIEANIDRFVITGLGLENLLWKKEIRAGKLRIDNPVIRLFINSDKNKKRDTMQLNIFLQNVFDRIRVNDIQVKEGVFAIRDKQKRQPLLEIGKFDLQLQNVMADSFTVNSPFPFRYQNLIFDAQQVIYRFSPYYTLKVHHASVQGKLIQLDSSRMEPTFSKSAFQNQIPYQKDWYSLTVPQIKISNLTWGFIQERLFFNMHSITFTKADFGVFRDRRSPQPPFVKKPLPGTFFRQLPFQLTVDSLFMHDSRITYEEHPVTERPAGKIIFSAITCSGTNITNNLNRLKQKPVSIVDAQSTFMGTTQLNAHFLFKLGSTQDDFTLKGSLGSLDDATLNKALIPMAGMSVEGKIKKVNFSIRGNDINAASSMQMLYDTLHLSILQKEGYKQNWLTTLFTNILMKKKNIPGEKPVITPSYSFTRYQDRSFFNFMWNCIKKGALNTILDGDRSQFRKKRVDKLMEKSSPAYQRSHQDETKNNPKR